MDISLAILVFLLTAGTAYLGVYVTLHPPEDEKQKTRFKLLFGALTIFAAIVIGYQTYLGRNAQKELDAIKHNTEQPPQVTVTPTITPTIQLNEPPSPQHTHVDWQNPLQMFQPTPPGIPFRVNEASGFNVGFVNVGDYVVNNCETVGAVYLAASGASSDQIFSKFRKERKLTPCGAVMPHSNKYTFHTYFTPKLSASDVQNLTDGKSYIFAVGRATWSDSTGRYLTESCYMIANNEPEASGFSAHSCTAHNQEVKLP